jgi:hypothetical protein
MPVVSPRESSACKITGMQAKSGGVHDVAWMQLDLRGDAGLDEPPDPIS